MRSKEELAKEFVVEAIKYGEARTSGNSKEIDKQTEKISKIEELFKCLGNNEINVLSVYLEDENEFVRLHVALSLLKTETNKAIEALSNLTKVRGAVAMEARIILREWKKGNL